MAPGIPPGIPGIPAGMALDIAEGIPGGITPGIAPPGIPGIAEPGIAEPSIAEPADVAIPLAGLGEALAIGAEDTAAVWELLELEPPPQPT